MSVIPLSHVAVTRARKSLNRAFSNGQWEELEQCDELLSETLNRAFDDSHKNHRYLMRELEQILALYGEVTKSLPADEVSIPHDATFNASENMGPLYCISSADIPRTHS